MRLHSWLALPLTLVALAASACRAGTVQSPGIATTEEPALAFTSVNVLPMTAGEPILRDHTVLVENGRIAAVGPSGSLQIPRNATTVDGRGKFLMPGLVDMHVHLEHFDDPEYLKLFLINGVTTVRNMDGRPNILDWKRQVAASALSGPDIHSAGPILDGSPPARPDNLALATPEEARSTVEQQAEAGYDFIKVYSNLAPAVFQAAVEAATSRNMQVAGHVPNALSIEEFLASGANSLEHLGDFSDAVAAPPPANEEAPDVLRRRLGLVADQRRMEALAAKVSASPVWVVPTMIQPDRAIAPAATVDRWANAPEMATVSGILDYWRGSVGRGAERLGNTNWHWVERGRGNRLALVQAFHRAGVPLLVGTDTPNPFVVPGFSVHDELANLVAAGMTPAEALASATREPARFLGQDQSWGTIEAGKRANLLLLDANPLEDISATRRIAGVVAGGPWITPERLQQMRADVERVAAASE